MQRWIVLPVLLALLAGCTQHDERPQAIDAWGTWSEDGSTLTVHVRALDKPFSPTRCDCDISVRVDDQELGTWQARPKDFQGVDGDSVWSVEIPGDQIPACEGDFDYSLSLEARLTVHGAEPLTRSAMLACRP